MDKEQLKSIIDSEVSSAMSSYGYSASSDSQKQSDLSNQRRLAMEYYLGLPFGNEADGRSQVVTSDVMDTIEWTMPSMMRVFTMSDEAVRFDPVGAEDEEQAKQETDYVNHVFYKENNGFLVLYTWFKDALLQKNGFVKIFWDESRTVTTETYQGLSDHEFAQLMEDDELEIIEHTEESSMEPVPQQTPKGIVFLPPLTPQIVHSAKFKRTKKKGCAKVLPVPPEEILVSRSCTSPDPNTAPFIAHRSKRTYSDLVQMGYEKSVLDDIGSTDSSVLTDEASSRYSYDFTYPEPSDSSDKSMRQYWVTEAYLQVDYDGDGIAELRKVCIAGNKILDNEEIDFIPFAVVSPILMPHKFFGLSMADTVMDIQLIRSTLLRQILDNMYLANNGRYTAVEGRVNLDDLMTSRPGGVVRVKDPSAVNQLAHVPIPPQTFMLMEYMDSMKENRTGVTRYNQGTDADSLNKTATGVNQIMNASAQRGDLIARVFAETGVKDLFYKLHQLLIKHQDKAKVVKLRNRWVQVNPTEWKTRSNLSVTVGLGTGNKDQTMGALSMILNIQKEMAMNGGGGILVTPGHIYNTVSKMVEAAGLKEAALFFSDPSLQKEPPAPPPPNPDVMAVQLTAQVEQGKLQLAREKMMVEIKLREAELNLEHTKVLYDAEIKSVKNQIEMLKAQAGAMNESEKNSIQQQANEMSARLEKLSLDYDARHNENKASIEKYKTELHGMMDLHKHETSMSLKSNEAIRKMSKGKTKINTSTDNV